MDDFDTFVLSAALRRLRVTTAVCHRPLSKKIANLVAHAIGCLVGPSRTAVVQMLLGLAGDRRDVAEVAAPDAAMHGAADVVEHVVELDMQMTRR